MARNRYHCGEGVPASSVLKAYPSWIVFVAAAILPLCALCVTADELPSADEPSRDAARRQIVERPAAFESPLKATQILDREVTDGHGHKIGKVRELALDVHNGRIVEVILAMGGFLGFGEHDTAVPAGEFSWNAQNKTLTCKVLPEDLRNAPPFDLGQWSSNVKPDKVREIYRRYNVSPYFFDEKGLPPQAAAKPAVQLTSVAMQSPPVHLGDVERVRTILGANTWNAQNEALGKIKNIIVDLPDSRIVVLIVSTGEFLEMGNEVSAIPAQAFHYSPNENVLRLNETRETLRSMPHFKPGQWPAAATPQRIATLYDAYRIPTYTVEPDNTAVNVRDQIGGNVTPFSQGRSASDREITAHIRREIMARPDLSIDAQNIKVITINGQVTLRGPVKNEDEEQTIVEIAKNAVKQDAKVTNEIQTIAAPPNAGGTH
jgi:sporulation protein YlmC with PRC-barrel domain